MVTRLVTSRERSRSCQIYLDGKILKSVGDSNGQTPCALNIIYCYVRFMLEWSRGVGSGNVKITLR